MAQKVIRDIPDDIMSAIEVKASESGKSAEAFIRDLLMQASAQPTIKTRYSFKAFGPESAYATIERRYADGHVQRGAKNCSQAQFDAYQKAGEYCQRIELGDYEAAYKLLLANFDEVFAS